MFELIFTERALKSLKKIPKNDAAKILDKLENIIKKPSSSTNIKQLTAHPLATFRLRVGNYRVLFDKEDTLKIIEIIEIGHRKNR